MGGTTRSRQLPEGSDQHGFQTSDLPFLGRVGSPSRKTRVFKLFRAVLPTIIRSLWQGQAALIAMANRLFHRLPAPTPIAGPCPPERWHRTTNFFEITQQVRTSLRMPPYGLHEVMSDAAAVST
jgi:hypothetical protein